MSATNMDHMKYLVDVANNDVAELERKEATYQGSWKQRGGVGAFMMAARKWDRLEAMAKRDSYDIFKAVASQSYRLIQETVGPSKSLSDIVGQDGTLIAEIRDLRRYLLLIEAELIATNALSTPWTGETNNKNATIEPRLVPRYGANHPGTPEDGGHHAREAAREAAITAASEIPPLAAVVRSESIPNALRIELIDPVTGNCCRIINRRLWKRSEVDEHMLAFPIQLNDHTFLETPMEYRGIYGRGVSSDGGWIMKKEFRDAWGK